MRQNKDGQKQQRVRSRLSNFRSEKTDNSNWQHQNENCCATEGEDTDFVHFTRDDFLSVKCLNAHSYEDQVYHN